MPNNAHAVLRRSIYNSRHNGLECFLKSFFQEILMKHSYKVLKFKKLVVIL